MTSNALTQIIMISQELEQTLEKQFAAVGRGLHEKITSVEMLVAPDVCKKIRLIATIRNKTIHEDLKHAELNLATVLQAYNVVKIELAKGPLSPAEHLPQRNLSLQNVTTQSPP